MCGWRWSREITGSESGVDGLGPHHVMRILCALAALIAR
jgi:hypothetical protein